MVARRLVLASASKARLGVLRTAGFAPEVVVSDVDEDGVEDLPIGEAARALAERKARAVVSRLAAAESEVKQLEQLEVVERVRRDDLAAAEGGLRLRVRAAASKRARVIRL